MKYPLEDLFRLRGIRKDKAEGELKAAERELVQAVENRRRLVGELDDYRNWRKAEVERRYLALLGQTLSLKELDAFHAGLAALESEELRLAEGLIQAEAAEGRARTKVGETRLAVTAADRALQKIGAHRGEWKEAEARELGRLEDLEMEEFTGAKPKI